MLVQKPLHNTGTIFWIDVHTKTLLHFGTPFFIDDSGAEFHAD